MAVVTHYETLKVSRSASVDVIRAAYRALAQRYHPDRNLNNPEAVLMMQLINVAYNTLTDPKKRMEHDAWITQQEPRKLAPVSQVPPEEQAKRDKLQKEITAWEAFAAKEAKEAESVRAKAAKAAQQAAAAGAAEKAKWNAYAKQAAEEATAAEAKAANTLKYANEKIAALGGIRAAPPPEKKVTTHYDTLGLARNAPLEVIKAVHKMLAMKYQPNESGTTPEALQMTQILNDSYKILSDPAKRAEHDAWIAQQEPKAAPDPAAAGAPRKTTAREVEFQAQADKLAKEAAALKAWAEQADAQAKEAEAKAAKSAKDAAAKAKDKDAAAWATFAAKEAANAKEMRDRATKAAEKAQAEGERAAQAVQQAVIEKQRAVREAAERIAEEEKNRALWEKNK